MEITGNNDETVLGTFFGGTLYFTVPSRPVVTAP